MPSLSGGNLGYQDPAVMPTGEPPPPASQAQRSVGRLRLGGHALYTEKCAHSREHTQGTGQAHGTKAESGCKEGDDAGAAGMVSGSAEDTTLQCIFTGPQKGQSMWRWRGQSTRRRQTALPGQAVGRGLPLGWHRGRAVGPPSSWKV